MDPIVHFELPSKNLAASRGFYESIFGWKITEWPMPDGSTYLGVHTTPINEQTHVPLKAGEINGGITGDTDVVKAPVFAILVESIDERVKQVQAAGGTVVMPKKDMMGMGFYAYVTDLDGNMIGLWENPKK